MLRGQRRKDRTIPRRVVALEIGLSDGVDRRTVST
jgi:hypothetical protein